jgi:hypothetical protein
MREEALAHGEVETDHQRGHHGRGAIQGADATIAPSIRSSRRRSTSSRTKSYSPSFRGQQGSVQLRLRTVIAGVSDRDLFEGEPQALAASRPTSLARVARIDRATRPAAQRYGLHALGVGDRISSIMASRAPVRSAGLGLYFVLLGVG